MEGINLHLLADRVTPIFVLDSRFFVSQIFSPLCVAFQCSGSHRLLSKFITFTNINKHRCTPPCMQVNKPNQFPQRSLYFIKLLLNIRLKVLPENVIVTLPHLKSTDIITKLINHFRYINMWICRKNVLMHLPQLKYSIHNFFIYFMFQTTRGPSATNSVRNEKKY